MGISNLLSGNNREAGPPNSLEEGVFNGEVIEVTESRNLVHFKAAESIQHNLASAAVAASNQAGKMYTSHEFPLYRGDTNELALYTPPETPVQPALAAATHTGTPESANTDSTSVFTSQANIGKQANTHEFALADTVSETPLQPLSINPELDPQVPVEDELAHQAQKLASANQDLDKIWKDMGIA
jgi:hypothetical protein